MIQSEVGPILGDVVGPDQGIQQLNKQFGSRLLILETVREASGEE